MLMGCSASKTSELQKDSLVMENEGTRAVSISYLGGQDVMPIEYLDCDNDDEQNDVRILVYVNGKEGLNTIVKNCKMDTLGEYVRVSILNTSKIGINSVDLPIKPVELDGFTNVGVDDFTKFGTTEKMNETTYSNFTYDFELTGEENFNKKLFTAYVKPTSTDSGWWGWRICIGGTSGPWGLSLNMPSTGEKLVVAQHDSNVLSSNWIDTEISASKANLTSFTQEPFLLQMGLEYQTMETYRVMLPEGIEGTLELAGEKYALKAGETILNKDVKKE